jgi:hypothetical protein
VPQEEGPNQDSELALSGNVRYRKQRRADSPIPLHLLRPVSGVVWRLCVEPRITSYALDRSFRYVFARRSSHSTDEAVLCPIILQQE